MIRIGFLASGGGSSARAIVEAAHGGLAVEPRVMVSNRKEAPALDFARAEGLPAVWIPTQADPVGADGRLADCLEAHGVELVVMSGYLKRLGPQTVGRFAGRILNIHPGPLPDFGGEGMYGRRVHEAVIARGAPRSAITIHLVDEEYDHGATLVAEPVPVEPGDTAESLEARVRALEPLVFVDTVRRLVAGDLRLPQVA